MKKQNLILSAALAAVFSASTAFAEAEVTGKIVHESAKFTTSGTTIGAAAAHGKDVMKTETSARIYIDGEADAMQEGATYHVELNLMRDSKGIGKYDSNESYTQRDALREAYVDTTVEDWSIRAGKQQVVWGTADGMKLLDAINPTDYSEMAQNQMEDSRIPVWMVNAEKDLAAGGNFQVVISQSKENKMAGLMHTESGLRDNDTNKSVDQGQAFVMKGVDTITGKTYGFLNLAPDMGQFAAGMGGFAQPLASDFGGDTSNGTTALDRWQTTPFSTIFAGADAAMAGSAQGTYYPQFVGFSTVSLGQDTAVMNTAGYNPTNPNAVFDLMGGTTAATMNGFANAGNGIYSEYRKKLASGSDLNKSIRYKNATENGVNYSLNYTNGFDSNPTVKVHWEDANGATVTSSSAFMTGTVGAGTQGDMNSIGTNTGATAGSGGYVVSISDSAGNAAVADRIVFTETQNKIQNIGGSFDMAVETAALGPVVIRGEALYQKDVTSPIIDKGKIFIGDLVGGLTMTEGDRFKYVLGADITVMTNMMVSAQFIQDRNLDYVDQASTAVDSANGAIYAGHSVYTGDMATMHITNGMNKAEENKEFYSLFFSKPFGASGEHRWNNITMYEENGGKWNRLDAEFSIDDDTQATVEYNKYWGDENTQFGQLEKSSNIQVGVKYSF